MGEGKKVRTFKDNARFLAQAMRWMAVPFTDQGQWEDGEISIGHVKFEIPMK